MNIARAFVRSFATKAPAPAGKAPAPAGKASNANKGLIKIKKLQEEFQKADGKPVFLKRGLPDQLLYRFTMGLCLIGIGWQLVFFWGYLKPNPPREPEPEAE